jgi:hypothetical protein
MATPCTSEDKGEKISSTQEEHHQILKRITQYREESEAETSIAARAKGNLHP